MITHIDNCILVDGIENITKGWLSKKIDEFTMGQAVANTGAVKKVSGPRKHKIHLSSNPIIHLRKVENCR